MTTEQEKNTFFSRLFGKRPIKSWRLWGLIFLLTYTLFGFLGVPYILKTQLIAKTPEFTDRTLSLQEVKFNPFALSLDMKGISLADLDGVELAGLDEFSVNFEVESLFRWAWTFGEIRFAGPRFNLRIDESGQSSFADLLASEDDLPAADNMENSQSELPRLVLHSFKVTDGQFMFEDRSIATPYQQKVSPISFELTDFSTLPEREGPYAIQATLPDGAAVRWQGEVSVNPIRSAGRVEIEQFDITTAWRYAQDQLRFAVDGGLLAASTQYALSMSGAEMALSLNDMKLALTDTIIRDKLRNEPDITLSEVTLSDGQLDLGKQQVQLEQLTIAGGEIRTFIDPQGEIDLARLFSPLEAPSSTQEQPPAEEAQDESGSPWLIELNRASVKGLSVAISDQTTAPAAEMRVDGISIELSSISNQQDDRFTLDASMNINKEGRLALQGEVGAMPVMADLSLELTTFPLESVQPYLNAATNLSLASGHAAFEGQLSYMKPQTPANLHLTGRVTVADFAADKRKTRGHVVAWKALTLDKLALQLEPGRLDIKTITLDKLQGQIVIAKDQTLNVAGLVKEDPAGTQSEPELEAESASEPFPITVGEVVLKRNAISFTDHSVAPRFTTQLSKLEGTISGLSSENIARADVKLNGKVDDYAQLKIAGQINPLSEELYTDLKIDFIDYDMASFTPYTGKFIGNTVDKGRMGLNLVYSVSEQELKGDNQILLDQFVLGKKVESEDATSLPVGLAIALLKDGQGRIDIDLPIRGNLDDPEFHVFHLIPPALLNLVTGIVSSPFKLLGKLAGGGSGELDNVVFQSGQTELAADQTERLTTLGKVLSKRPQLILEIRGQYDPALDKIVLQQQKLHEALQVAVDAPIESLDLALLETYYIGQTDGERLTAIKNENSHLPEGAKDGDARVIDQPAYQIGLYKEAAALQPLIEDDLRDLALARANHVRNYLVANAGLAAERVFILEAGAVAPNTSELIRTQFNLGAN
jgi:hypothetical protein